MGFSLVGMWATIKKRKRKENSFNQNPKLKGQFCGYSSSWWPAISCRHLCFLPGSTQHLLRLHSFLKGQIFSVPKLSFISFEGRISIPNPIQVSSIFDCFYISWFSIRMIWDSFICIDVSIFVFNFVSMQDFFFWVLKVLLLCLVNPWIMLFGDEFSQINITDAINTILLDLIVFFITRLVS